MLGVGGVGAGVVWTAAVLLLPLTTALRPPRLSLAFTVDYFHQRHVPCVCLFTCHGHDARTDRLWGVRFTRAANNRSISVSNVVLATEDEAGGRRLDFERISRCLKQQFTHVGVLVAAGCDHTQPLLDIASREMWLDFRHIWLIVDEEEHVSDNSTAGATDVIEVLKLMNISVDADIVLAKMAGADHVTLYDVYNFGKVQGGILIVKEVGFWSKNIGLVADLHTYKYYRRWDFGGWKIRMISVVTSASPAGFSVEQLSSEQPVAGVSVVTRTSTAAIVVLAQVHNFQFVHQLTDRWRSVFNGNNCRSAAAVSLYCRENDITSVLRYNVGLTDRVTLIHPSLTYIETRYFYRIPTSGCGKYENEFLRPLSAGTWWCFTAVCALGGAVLLAAARLERRPAPAQYALFTVLASLTQQFFQDESVVRRNSAGRKLTVLVTGMSCVLIYNYYTSSVVSWLLSAAPPSLASLADLYRSPLHLLYEDIGYTRTWLNIPEYYYNKANAKDEDAIKRKVLTKWGGSVLKPVEEGIALVKAGGYAYHTETDSANRLIAETFTEREVCEVGSLSSLPPTRLYPALQRDSPYKEFFTWSLTRVAERGVVSCLQRRTWSRAARCRASAPRALALGGAAPAFLLLALGLLAALLILLGERVVYYLKNKQKHINTFTY